MPPPDWVSRTLLTVDIALLCPLYPDQRDQLQLHMHLPCSEGETPRWSGDPVCELRVSGMLLWRLKKERYDLYDDLEIEC